jgi:hypothetical protein
VWRRIFLKSVKMMRYYTAGGAPLQALLRVALLFTIPRHAVSLDSSSFNVSGSNVVGVDGCYHRVPPGVFGKGEGWAHLRYSGSTAVIRRESKKLWVLSSGR